MIENEKPSSKDTVDSSMRTITNDQRRSKSATTIPTTVMTNEEMNDLEERFEKWINDRSKKPLDDLFDGLKVSHLSPHRQNHVSSFQVFLGQFSSNLRMRIQKILDGGCAIRSVHIFWDQ